jgi:hypothetical protein
LEGNIGLIAHLFFMVTCAICITKISSENVHWMTKAHQIFAPLWQLIIIEWRSGLLAFYYLEVGSWVVPNSNDEYI